MSVLAAEIERAKMRLFRAEQEAVLGDGKTSETSLASLRTDVLIAQNDRIIELLVELLWR